MKPKLRILVVDDEPLIRQTSALVLAGQGYEVRTAEDGVAALAELGQSVPDLIISDLSMPKMSEYSSTKQTATIADAYFNKGNYTPEELFAKISQLLAKRPLRPNTLKPSKAPVWIPRNASGYVIITCTECLRSFSLPKKLLMCKKRVREVRCEFCGTLVQVSNTI